MSLTINYFHLIFYILIYIRLIKKWFHYSFYVKISNNNINLMVHDINYFVYPGICSDTHHDRGWTGNINISGFLHYLRWGLCQIQLWICISTFICAFCDYRSAYRAFFQSIGQGRVGWEYHEKKSKQYSFKCIPSIIGYCYSLSVYMDAMLII